MVELDVRTAWQLQQAASRAGATDSDLRALTNHEVLKQILPFLRGDAKVVLRSEEELKANNKYLRPLYGTGDIRTIKATTGKRTLVSCNASRGTVKKKTLSEPGPATEETKVAIYEMYFVDGKFSQIYGSLSDDVEGLCLTQDQIIEFVENNYGLFEGLKPSVFFLFKLSSGLFVVRAHKSIVGIAYIINRFQDQTVWEARHGARFVVPVIAK